MSAYTAQTAIEVYAQPSRYPKLTAQQHVIKRAVRALVRGKQKVDALALIRGTYTLEDGTIATLDEAKEILAAILSESYW